MIKQENIKGHVVKYYKSDAKNKKYKAVIFDGDKKIKTVNFGDIRYKNGKNSIEKGKYEWDTKKENEEHRKRYKQRHKGDNLNQFSPGFFSYYKLW